MIRKRKEMRREVSRENFVLEHVFSKEELCGKSSLIARIMLGPGDAATMHEHLEDAELYYVISGEIVTVENGVESMLHAGDASFTAGGAHSVENRSNENAEFLAVVFA